jgi:hypothetical protein
MTNLKTDSILHLNPLHFDAPGIGGLVQRLLHDVADCFPFREDLGQMLCSEDVTQGGCSQQVRRMAAIKVEDTFCKENRH